MPPAVKTKKKYSISFPLQTGKKTRPFLFKINCPWKARSDSISLGPSRALCRLFLVLLWLLASRSRNQHIEELQDRNSSILPLCLQLILFCIYLWFVWLVPCAWDDLLFIPMTDLPISPVGGSLNLYLNLPHYLTLKSWLPTVCEASAGVS